MALMMSSSGLLGLSNHVDFVWDFDLEVVLTTGALWKQKTDEIGDQNILEANVRPVFERKIC